MATGTRVVDNLMPVHAFREGVPSGAAPLWANLKGYDHVGILLSYNNATTVTASAITVNQATSIAGAGSKPIPFTVAFSRVNFPTNPLFSQIAVVGNTFTMDSTNSQYGEYFIEIDADQLDDMNGYKYFQVGIANAVAQTVGAWYLMGNPPRYAGGFDSMMNPVV
jgi:hypothetical protein